MGIFDILKPERPVMKVCMMGPKAVGKTTILTAVFNETQQSIAETKLNLLALGDTNSNLLDRQRMLKAMFRNKTEVVDSAQNRDVKKNRPGGGIEASSYETQFDFTFGFLGKDPIVDLMIKDFPGEMVVNQSDNVVSFIKDSHAVFVAIDTPHLMENNGEFNEVKNKPEVIIQLFVEALQEHDDEKLVVLIPLKCEKYFHEKRMNEVVAKVEDKYSSLISLFKGDNKICCTIAPILTLGDVEFDDFTYDGGNVRLAPDKCPENVLYKYVGECKYSPLFCSQPLYALLSFVAAQYKRNKDGGFLNRIKQMIWNIFKNNEELYDEIIKMEKIRITHNELFGYKMLCGERLFHYNH